MTIDELQVPKGLTLRAFGIYMYAYCEGGGQFTVAGLTEVFAEGRDAIRTATAELVARGLATLQVSSEDGMRRTAYVLDSRFGPSAIVVDEG